MSSSQYLGPLGNSPRDVYRSPETVHSASNPTARFRLVVNSLFRTMSVLLLWVELEEDCGVDDCFLCVLGGVRDWVDLCCLGEYVLSCLFVSGKTETWACV